MSSLKAWSAALACGYLALARTDVTGVRVRRHATTAVLRKKGFQ